MLLDGSTPAANDIVDFIEWAQHCLVNVLSIILDGPTVAAETCRQYYWMGLQLPLRHAVNVIEWALYSSEIVLSIILNGPLDAAETSRWCYWTGPRLRPITLLMLLNGPSVDL
jgi:hypothetical protein